MLVAQDGLEVRQELLQRLTEARGRTDELFDIVRAEAIYDRPIPERHRIVFYLGHLEAFDWNLMRERVLGAKAFYPEFDKLFNFGIDPVGGGLPSDQPEAWPAVAEVRKYAGRVRENLDAGLGAVLSSESKSGVSEEFSTRQLLNVAVEHRLMHAECCTSCRFTARFRKCAGSSWSVVELSRRWLRSRLGRRRLDFRALTPRLVGTTSTR